MGEALRKSSSVSLFHEYASHRFFRAIEDLFAEEQRHRGYEAFPSHEAFLPTREKHAANIAASVFEAVCGRRSPIIGTKFPGHQYWPRPPMPPGVVWKELVATRNPYDTVLSYTAKMVRDGEESRPADGWKRALAQWIHAWNHAVLNRSNPNFLNLFYDEFGEDNAAIAQQVADFLEIERDFDLAGLIPRPTSEIEKKFQQAGLLEAYYALAAISSYSEWPSTGHATQASGRLYGYPLPPGGIDFRSAGNSWMHVQNGFHSPEADGSWTNGSSATITFSVQRSAPALMYLILDIVWSVEINEVPTNLSIFVDGTEVATTDIILAESNGSGRQFQFVVPDYASDGRGSFVEIKVNNPRNPKILGISRDDRNLGVMLRSLRFQALPESQVPLAYPIPGANL